MVSTTSRPTASVPLDRRPIAVYTDSEDIDHSAGMDLLRSAGFDVRLLQSQDPRVIADGARDADALLVGYAPISAELIAGMPNLRIISLLSMGVDSVDVGAATAAGVWVTNIPGIATEEVAAHALTLSLTLVRNIQFYRRSLADGDWMARPSTAPPRLSETTLGILGLGRIGSRLGQMAANVFGEVIGFDLLLPDTVSEASRLGEAGIRRTGFDEVLETSDVLSLHLPLTHETHELIDAARIARMPRGSFLVNVSRGGLIDSSALTAALDSGWLAGAALDVLDTEPPEPGHPLMTGRENLIVTPHVAYLSQRTERDYVRIQAENVADCLREGRPRNPVNDLDIPDNWSTP